jgi:hypothetical protein
MKSKQSLSIILGLVVIGVTSTMLFPTNAHAQFKNKRRTYPIGANTTSIPARFEIQLGSVAPEKNRKSVGSQGLLWGVGYRLSDSETGGSNASTGQTTLDFVQGKLSKSGNRLDSSGLFYTERLPISGTTLEKGGYYGLGLGVARSTVKISPAASASSTQFAARAILGFSLSDRLRLESSYIWTKKVKTYSVGQFTAALGVRF